MFLLLLESLVLIFGGNGEVTIPPVRCVCASRHLSSIGPPGLLCGLLGCESISFFQGLSFISDHARNGLGIEDLP